MLTIANSGVPAPGVEIQACQDRPSSLEFIHGVSAAGRWNAFLIPADCGGCYSIEENAISSVPWLAFRLREKNSQWTAIPLASARYFGHTTMLWKKCKLTRGLPYLWDARFMTRVHARIERLHSLFWNVESPQWFFYEYRCVKDGYKFPWSI